MKCLRKHFRSRNILFYIRQFLRCTDSHSITARHLYILPRNEVLHHIYSTNLFPVYCFRHDDRIAARRLCAEQLDPIISPCTQTISLIKILFHIYMCCCKCCVASSKHIPSMTLPLIIELCFLERLDRLSSSLLGSSISGTQVLTVGFYPVYCQGLTFSPIRQTMNIIQGYLGSSLQCNLFQTIVILKLS